MRTAVMVHWCCYVVALSFIVISDTIPSVLAYGLIAFVSAAGGPPERT